MVLFKKLKSHRKINTRLREQADRKHSFECIFMTNCKLRKDEIQHRKQLKSYTTEHTEKKIITGSVTSLCSGRYFHIAYIGMASLTSWAVCSVPHPGGWAGRKLRSLWLLAAHSHQKGPHTPREAQGHPGKEKKNAGTDHAGGCHLAEGQILLPVTCSSCQRSATGLREGSASTVRRTTGATSQS